MTQVILTNFYHVWEQARFDVPEGMDVESDEFDEWKDKLWEIDSGFEEIDRSWEDAQVDID